MIIKIDSREVALLNQITAQISTIPSFKSIQIKTENLPIGDVIICDETEDKIIIERKTVSDLMSSIKDGRYEEQSYRLNGINHHNHNIVYLIEGDVNRVNRFKSDSHVEKLTLYSAMFSLNYYKGFSAFRSFSLDETANIICNMAYKLGKDVTKQPYYTNKVTDVIQSSESTVLSDNNEATEKDYICVVKKIKKDNITPENIGEIMLCQIPGISSVTALAVMEKYHTMQNLINELESNSESLKDLSYTNAKGQVRKVNKTCIMNIVKFLLKK